MAEDTKVTGVTIPYVIETKGREERVYDIYSRLLKDRIIFIGTAIEDTLANAVIAQLLFLEAEDPERDIFIYINSPGGVVSSGMANTSGCRPKQSSIMLVPEPFIPTTKIGAISGLAIEVESVLRRFCVMLLRP